MVNRLNINILIDKETINKKKIDANIPVRKIITVSKKSDTSKILKKTNVSNAINNLY